MPDFINLANDSMRIVIDFDVAVYSPKAIKRAAYEFSNQANIEIKSNGSKVISAIISVPNLHVIDNEKFIREFKESVFDHQIRLDVEEDYRTIRQMIVAQAFQPCDNLDEFIDTLKNGKKI